MTDIASIACGLSGAQTRNLFALPDRVGIWMTVSEMRSKGATGSGMDILFVHRRGGPLLCDRRWVTWGPDRVNQQLRGEGYEYTPTQDGLRVRAFLRGEGK